MSRIITDDTAAFLRELINRERTRRLGRTHTEYDAHLDVALRDLTPTSPDEHQVNLAGGDGEWERARKLAYEGRCHNIMHDSEGAIYCVDTKNHAGAHHNASRSWNWETPEPRTEDYTLTELFPVQTDGFTGDHCQECGAWVPGRFQQLHVAWHNKLLP